MPKTVIAKDGDTLCRLAVDNGFKDCAKLRTANPQFNTKDLKAGDSVTIPDIAPRSDPGPVDQRHKFRRPGRPVASIRYVHGSATLGLASDPTLTNLNISRFVTDKAGNPDGSANFVNDTVRTFEANANKDPDTFKVEVLDLRTTKTDLNVDLEALRPIYDPADPKHRKILRHESFPGAEKARRSLNAVVVTKQGSSKRFRSCYLRLVTDDQDNKQAAASGAPPAGTFPPAAGHLGRPKQTVLVTDMTDEGDVNVEILDQLVEATYVIDKCPGPANFKCKVKTRATLGTDRRRMHIAVHVLRNRPQANGGTPIVPLNDAVRRVRRWFRRAYAQASIGPDIVLSQEVDPVENLVTVSEAPFNGGNNSGGINASGFAAAPPAGGPAPPSRFGFRLNNGTPAQSRVIGPISPGAGSTPIATANLLVGAINTPGSIYTARATQNPRRFRDTGRSADIIITAAGGAHVTIDQLVSTDTAQRLAIVSVNPLPTGQTMLDWSDRFIAGSTHHRVILKNYDTGNNRVDVFVVDSFTNGDRGEALMRASFFSSADASLTALAQVEFSVFCILTTMNAGDGDPFVLPHEVGHVAADVGHSVTHPPGSAAVLTREVFQLMCDRVSGISDVGSSKRVRNANVRYDLVNANVNMGARVRSQGGGLLENW